MHDFFWFYLSGGISLKYTSSVQRKGADCAARALKSMIQGLGQIFQLFLKIWVMKVIAESMVKKLFVDFLGGTIGFKKSDQGKNPEK